MVSAVLIRIHLHFENAGKLSNFRVEIMIGFSYNA